MMEAVATAEADNQIAEAPTHVLVLGTADWDQPIATNQHYVTREIGAEGGTRVTFVESMGLRRPTLSGPDLRRIAKRLGRVVGPPSSSKVTREIPSWLTVRPPFVIPFHRGVFRGVNRTLLNRTVGDWLRYSGPKVLWTYSPLTYGLEQEADFTVYHCVDLLATVPGIDGCVVRRGESLLASRGAHAIATSAVVKTHLEEIGFAEPKLWTNVADTSVFLDADPRTTRRVPGRVVFGGNLTPRKVDFDLLLALADRGLEVVVAGPTDDGGPEIERIIEGMKGRGVSYAGLMNLQQLAGLFSTATVGLIPYVLNEYTRGVSPLKTYEYAASGLAVVSTRLPGVTARDGFVWVADREDFVDSVVEADASMSIESIDERIGIAELHGWAERGRQVRSLLSTAAPMLSQR